MPNFIDLMKQTAIEAMNTADPTGILFGIVTSVTPLKITVEQRLILDESRLVLTKNVIDYKTQISFDNPNIKQVFTTWNMDETTESSQQKISFKQSVKHDVTVYNGLKVNDKVILIRVQGGQKYIVLEKVVT